MPFIGDTAPAQSASHGVGSGADSEADPFRDDPSDPSARPPRPTDEEAAAKATHEVTARLDEDEL